MKQMRFIQPPFFEIGPKSYLYGDDIIELAKIVDEASEKYGVQVIFTAPYLSIAEVARVTKNLVVCAPFMDNIPIGRGYTRILPEGIKAAGAVGVMLNHSEHPLTLSDLCGTVKRAENLYLGTVICADSVNEIKMVAQLHPDVIIAEPVELIGTGKAGDLSYVKQSMDVIKAIDPNIQVLVGAGITTGQDVYDVIYAGADATGSSSGIMKAPDKRAIVNEMLCAARQAWDDRHAGK